MCGPTPPPPPPPTKISLTIGATTQIPFPPTLANDSGFTSITEDADKNTVTLVKPGNIMIWKMTEDVIEINAITENEGNDVFSTNPAKQSDGTWQAVVGNFPAGNYWDYNIIYTVKGAPNNPYTQDPKIRINN
jgi:hypothetical protein